MPQFSLDDLTTPLTRTEVQAKIYEILGVVGTDTTAWKPGGVVRTVIAAASVVLAAFSALTAQLARMGFLELANGKWLELVAWYVYRVEKEQATHASGEVTLTNAGGGLYELDAGDLILRNPTTNRTYRNAASVSLGAQATVTIPVLAVEAGAASTSAPGAITELVTTLVGVDVTNAAPVVGRDEESDTSLRARCSEKLGSLSPFGPWDAYSYAARTATRSDGTSIGITRVRNHKDGFGNVVTYVATAAGAVTGAVDNPASDLGLVHDAIQRRAAPLAVTAWVQSATPLSIPVVYRVWMYNTSGLTQAQIIEIIRGRLVSFMASQPVGGHVVGVEQGRVYHDAIRTVIGAALPQIIHVEVVLPAADVPVAMSQVPVLGPVSAVSITQVPPSEGGVA